MAIDKWKGGAAAAGVILLVGYCSTPRAEQQTGGVTTSASAELENSISAKARTSDAVSDGVARSTVIDKMPPVGGETYDEYATRRDALEGAAGSFEGDECTVDCGGHEAGREWAKQRGVTDEGECGGRSWSFREGCAAYAREQGAEANQEADPYSEDDEQWTVREPDRQLPRHGHLVADLMR
ncbi:MAG: hypothetical protein H7267_13145 [Sandarakinorhabdus sp.]|nr:hypothetical protein [Sandarakinorhabdus sp.]